MSNNPYFYSVTGIASNAPTPGDNEVTSLQKINALLAIIANNGGGGSNVGHFDSLGNIQVYDSVNTEWRTLTAPNGVLTVT
jgi:hypothetical protein